MKLEVSRKYTCRAATNADNPIANRKIRKKVGIASSVTHVGRKPVTRKMTAKTIIVG